MTTWHKCPLCGLEVPAMHYATHWCPKQKTEPTEGSMENE